MYVANIWAVIVATVVAFIIGWLWYSPAVFGKKWARYTGVSEESMQNPRGLAKKMLINFVGVLVMVWVFAHFAVGLGIVDVASAVEFAFWIWLAFFATQTGAQLWEGKSWKLWCINSMYSLVVLQAVALIVALWQ